MNTHMRTTNPAALQLLAELYNLSERIGISGQEGWLATVESYRLQGYGETLEKAKLRGLEELAGGYWVDAPSGSLATHTMSDTRFIHRDMCVRCCSLRRDHLEDGRCLFAPRSTFEETKP